MIGVSWPSGAFLAQRWCASAVSDVADDTRAGTQPFSFLPIQSAMADAADPAGTGSLLLPAAPGVDLRSPLLPARRPRHVERNAASRQSPRRDFRRRAGSVPAPEAHRLSVFSSAIACASSIGFRGRHVFSSLGRNLVSDRKPDESIAQPEPTPASPGEVMQVCPNCSAQMRDRSCKLVCPQCGFFLSCSDFY